VVRDESNLDDQEVLDARVVKRKVDSARGRRVVVRDGQLFEDELEAVLSEDNGVETLVGILFLLPRIIEIEVVRDLAWVGGGGV
jgi:hypothetical protein